jgi:hypothetical protein
MRLVSNSQANHLQPVMGRRDGLIWLVGRASRWHKEDAIQIQLVMCLHGSDEMAVMDWVKGTTQDAQPRN